MTRDVIKKGLKLRDVVMDLWLVVGLTSDLTKKGLKRYYYVYGYFVFNLF